MINGEEAFKAVHLAIAQATKTIDIICWGFQPSMYFIRDGKSLSIGELLMDKARKGVEVRMLGWEMPFNSAGQAGEANLPGKGPYRLANRALQPSTDDQYAYDRQWFFRCAFDDNLAAAIRAARNVPVFVSRGFSLFERAEIAHQVQYHSADPHISLGAVGAMTAAATHHQKTVLVDYEIPDRAVGFVMGHNMLDEYWDTSDHSALNRTLDTKPAANGGPRGDTPRQDISSQVSGPILEHLHHNFATAWRKETGEDLLASRQAMQVGPTLQCTPGATRQLAQLVRTQPQEGKRDIEQLYLKAVNNATQFIYIENQYFRWPPLAEKIKSCVAAQLKAGRDPEVHGYVYLFVITNATDDGMGKGTVNTQRMLESLGRGETIPAITKLRRIEQAKAQSAITEPSSAEIIEKKALSVLTSLLDSRAGVTSSNAKEAACETADNNRKRLARLDKQIEEINTSVLKANTPHGLKVHICSLVAPDSPAGKPWMPVYIHSKLMIVDDVFTTHGSANINTRSMQGDSEMNIAHEWASVTEALRRRLWDMHTKGNGAQDDPKQAFDAWQDIIKENKDRQEKMDVPDSPLVEFYYGASTLKDLD